MNAAQLSADVTLLKAANQRVKGAIGADRFRAAQAAIAQEQRQGGGGSSNGSQTASSDPDGSEEVLALVRQFGLPGFKSSSEGSPAKTNTTAGLSASERADLAILRKAGILKEDV